MDPNQLTRPERMALVGLLKLIIQADEEFSKEEGKELNRIAERLGWEAWNESKQQAMAEFRSLDDVKAFAKTITRQPARELIYDMLLDVALPGSVVPQEKQALDWLAELWEIHGD